MSKDDYFVLAYKLLRYLYRCLKEGTPASWDIIAPIPRTSRYRNSTSPT